jgi:hypothetical protein
VIRDTLLTADDLKEAMAMVGGATHLRGYRVLVTHGAGSEAKVVEFGRWVAVRELNDGLLFGSSPQDKDLDAPTRERYVRLKELVEPLETVSAPDLERVLSDRHPEASEPGRILNPQTRHSVVFEPGARRLRVAAPDESGKLGPYVEFSLAEAAP